MKKYKKGLTVKLSTDQRTVTGSSNLLSVEEYLILIDYGINSENSLFHKLNTEITFEIEKLKAVFLTHVHADHVAKVALLYRKGYIGKLYLSKESSILLESILRDNLKIMIEEAKKKAISPIYGEEDINTVFLSIRRNIEKIDLLFSGDWNNKCNILKKKNHLMKEVLRSKNINLILESTYGSNINKIEKPNFETILLDEMKKGKKIFVAVNSLHKSSEVISRIKDLQEQNENLFKDYSIYLDGKLTNKLNNIYMGILKKNFMPLGIKSILEKSERFEAIEATKTIIISSSGMMTNGPIRRYLSEFIEDENSSFIISSYCAEGTVGKYLVEKFKRREKKVELFGKKFKLKASILQAKNISSHGTGAEMIEEIIKKIPKENISSILLNHGEDEIREKFKKMIIFKTGLSEEKIFLYDSRKKFIFNKNGLKKVIELSNYNGVKKEMKDKKEKCETHRRVSHRIK